MSFNIAAIDKGQGIVTKPPAPPAPRQLRKFMRSIRDFMSEKVRPLSLSTLKVNKPIKNLLFLLFNNDAIRLLYCPKDGLGNAKNINELITGSSIVTVEKQHFYFTGRTNGRHIDLLFEHGILSVDTDTPKQTPKSVLFKLSDAVKNNRRHVYRETILRGIGRMTMPYLQSLARIYGLQIEYEPKYKLFRIRQCDGSKVAKDDYVFSNPLKKGAPIVKVTDLNILEWDDLLFSYHLKAENKKAAREKQKAAKQSKK